VISADASVLQGVKNDINDRLVVPPRRAHYNVIASDVTVDSLEAVLLRSIGYARTVSD
jgi:hypothetical protein